MGLNKVIFASLFWLLSCNLATAQKASLSNANVDDFPKVELEFNYRNPIPLDSTKIKLFENGKSVNDFTLSEKSTKNPFTSKQILILIENSYWERFDKQLAQVKKLWSEIAEKTIRKDDEVFVATFDWTNENSNIQVLNENGLNSPTKVNNLIQSIVEPPKDGRKHKSTEIFPALLEGISFLESQNKNDSVAMAVLLFSSEFNNIYNNTQTKTDVIISARNSGIPIYAFRYPYSNKYNLQDIAENSYGIQFNMLEASNEKVIESINQIPERYAGQNCILNFDSPIDANNDFRDVEIVVSDEESFELRYQSPSSWNVIWKNKSYRYGIIALGLLIVGFIIALWFLFKKRRKSQLVHIQRIKQETENAVYEDQMTRAEEKRIDEEKEQEKQKKEFENVLHKHFSRLPRPVKLVTSEGTEVEVSKSVFNIGRRTGNDLLLNNSTISKIHAILYFDHIPGTFQLLNKKQFVIIDADSTNGTFVNGNRIPTLSQINEGAKPYFLSDSDLIQIGEVSITFMD